MPDKPQDAISSNATQHDAASVGTRPLIETAREPELIIATPTGPKAHVPCPHCKNSISLAGQVGENALCGVCGSSFRVENISSQETLEQIRLLGRFKLLHRLGQGTFGVVWKALDPQLERLVALKIPHSSLLNASNIRDRFIREARSAAQLRHPGIVSVHEVIELDGNPAIVCDFISGMTLKELTDVKPLTFRQAAALVAEVADAVDYANNRGLVHRDLKPGNILVDSSEITEPREERKELSRIGRPLVADFGLALKQEAEIVMTIDGYIIGTPAYMSPEQARGQGHKADRRSDVYSLGVILYELLCSELPFRGSKAMVVHQVVHEDPRPPRRSNDKVPRDLETICLKAMAKNPAWRYPTAGEMAADLRRFLQGEPIKARPVGKAETLWRWCKRKPALATTGTIALFAVVASCVFLGLFLVHQARALRQSQHSEASISFIKAMESCEKGDASTGQLWFARALKSVPPGDELERVIRQNLSAWNRKVSPLRGLVPIEIQTPVYSADGRLCISRSPPWNLIHLTPGKSRILRDAKNLEDIRNIALSPDAKVLAVVTPLEHDSRGKVITSRVRRWNLDSGKEIKPSWEPNTVVSSLCFSPEGTTLAFGCTDHRIRLWDTLSGSPICELSGHSDAVVTVQYAGAGDRMLSGSMDGTVCLWQPAKRKVLYRLVHPDFRGMTILSKDDSKIVTCTKEQIKVWNSATGKLERQFSIPSAFSPVASNHDGTIVATASLGNAVRVFDVKSGKQISAPLPHNAPVKMVVFQDDVLLTGTEDGRIRQWDTKNLGYGSQVFQYSKGTITAVLSPCGRMLAIVSDSGSECQIVETTTGSQLFRLESTMPIAVAGLCFSQDSSLLAVPSLNGSVRLFETSTGQERMHVRHASVPVIGVAFAPHQSYFVTAGEDGTIRSWDCVDGKGIREPLVHSCPVGFIYFNPQGDRLLAGTASDGVWIWEMSTNPPAGIKLNQPGSISAACFSPDGRFAATAADRTARIWDLGSNQPIGLPLVHEDLIRAMDFSPDGKKILTASHDHTARLWDARSGDPIGSPMQQQGPIDSARFGSGGKAILTASQDNRARLWDTATQRPIGPQFEHAGPVRRAFFMPDGQRIITASQDGTVKIWPIPKLVEGDRERIILWTEVTTGLWLDDAQMVRFLDPADWEARWKKLEELGGPPE